MPSSRKILFSSKTEVGCALLINYLLLSTKGMKDLDKVSLSMARLGKIDLRGEPISGFLLPLNK
jgi:hypothetical protein